MSCLLKYYKYEKSERKHLKDALKNDTCKQWIWIMINQKKYKLPRMVVWHVSHQPWAFTYGFHLWLLCIWISAYGIGNFKSKNHHTFRSNSMRFKKKKNCKEAEFLWISILKIEVISNGIFAFVPCATITIWYVHFWNTRYFMYEIEWKLKPLKCDSIAW